MEMTVQLVEEKGARLAAALNRRIDAMTNDETSRGDVIADMGRAAGISSGTVNQILRGDINCPPQRRLEGFARALDLSASSLISAAERDGCTYGSNMDQDGVIAKVVNTG